jgi:tetratricopeptide (TPR) repeat protein
MGFRLQKSFRIARGVRLNVSKTGLGMSVGVPGLRYSLHSSGRETGTVGIPGSGMRYQVTHKVGARPRGGASPQPVHAPAPAPISLPKPGLFASSGEKALHKAIEEHDGVAVATAGDEFPEHRALAHALAGFMLFETNPAEARRLLFDVFASGEDPMSDAFASKYVGGTRVTVGIARGVTATLPLDRDAVGLALAELQQSAGEVPAAIDTIEHLEPSHHAAVSLAELYVLTGRFKDVVDLTTGVENVDDSTALLCAFRGQALNELGFHDAAIESFKQALRFRSRAAEIRHFAWSERARAYEALGRRVLARKDLERILAADSTYDLLRERIASLGD